MEDTADSGLQTARGEVTVRIPPLRHVGEVDVSEVDASSAVRVTVRVEMDGGSGCGEMQPSGCRDSVTLEMTA